VASTTLTPEAGAPEQTAVRSSDPTPRRRKSPRDGGHWPWFALPAVVLVAVFFALPFALNAGFAFSDWSGFSDEIGFNGIDNFRTLIDQEIFWPAVRTTLLYAVCMLVFAMAVSLTLALALESTTRINTVFRSLFFIPVLISPLAAGYIWKGMLAPNGPINGMLSFLLPGTVDTAWLGDPTTALPAVALIEAWKWSGLITLVYIAGLKAIPKEMLEAATIDGANAWQKFRYLTLPMISPFLMIAVIIRGIDAIKSFDIIYAMTQGGPGTASETINIYLYNTAFSYYDIGYGSAMAVVFFILIVALSFMLLMMRQRTKWTDAEGH